MGSFGHSSAVSLRRSARCGPVRLSLKWRFRSPPGGMQAAIPPPAWSSNDRNLWQEGTVDSLAATVSSGSAARLERRLRGPRWRLPWERFQRLLACDGSRGSAPAMTPSTAPHDGYTADRVDRPVREDSSVNNAELTRAPTCGKVARPAPRRRRPLLQSELRNGAIEVLQRPSRVAGNSAPPRTKGRGERVQRRADVFGAHRPPT